MARGVLRVLLLVDARQSMKQSDRDFLLWLDREAEVPLHLVLRLPYMQIFVKTLTGKVIALEYVKSDTPLVRGLGLPNGAKPWVFFKYAPVAISVPL